MKEKSRIFVWTLFDFANTSFSIVVVTFVYAVYFKKTVAQNLPIGDLYWSISTSIAMIITAIISPILGAIADYATGKKRFLLFFTLICIAATSLLYFVGEGMVFWGIFLLLASDVEGRGHPWRVSMISMMTAVATAVLGLILIPSWNSVGAAIVSSVAQGISMFLVIQLYKRMIGVKLAQLLIPTVEDLRGFVKIINLFLVNRRRIVAPSLACREKKPVI